MLQRIKFLAQATRKLTALRKSELFRELNLKQQASLVSSRHTSQRPHFLFRSEIARTNHPVLIKMTLEDKDRSLGFEAEAFEIISKAKPASLKFQYPKIHGYDPNVPFLVMDFVKGDTLKVFEENGLNDVEKDKLMKRIVDWVKELQDVQKENAEIWNPVAIVEEKFQRIDNFQTMRANQREAILAIKAELLKAANALPAQRKKRSIFCHGDLHLGNIFVAQEIHVIDFAQYSYGIIESDPGHLAFSSWAFLNWNSEELLTMISRHHGRLNDSLLRYCFKEAALLWTISKIKNTKPKERLKDNVLEVVERIFRKYDMDLPDGL